MGDSRVVLGNLTNAVLHPPSGDQPPRFVEAPVSEVGLQPGAGGGVQGDGELCPLHAELEAIKRIAGKTTS